MAEKRKGSWKRKRKIWIGKKLTSHYGRDDECREREEYTRNN
jgi:hypothetical protein